jgi:hypothetical protein
MTERWIKWCEDALKRIQELSEKEDKDRLEQLRSIKISLSFLLNSVSGWTRWINNPDIMSNFTEKEFEEIEKQLASFTTSFIEYDMKITKIGLEKGLKKRTIREKRKYVV